MALTMKRCFSLLLILTTSCTHVVFVTTGDETESLGEMGTDPGSSTEPEPFCGNGHIDPGEECDDRSFRCRDCLYLRLAFLSSLPLPGKMGPDAEENLRKADALCQDLAVQGGLALAQSGRIFRAWLSTAQVATWSRLSLGEGSYSLPTGEIVAHKGSELFSGTLEHAIDVSEDGGVSVETLVWTGTLAGGGSHASTCSGWTSEEVKGSVGWSGYRDPRWSQAGLAPCGDAYPIYCVETIE